MKPTPITPEELSALCVAWQAHCDAEAARMDHWSSLPDDWGRHERFKNDPQVVALRAAVDTTRDAATALTNETRQRCPWLDFLHRIGGGVPGTEIKRFIGDNYFDACRDVWMESNKSELAAIRDAIKPLPELTEPPTSGHVFDTSRQRAWRVTKATHRGSRVWASGHDGKEVRLLPWRISGTHYKSLPEPLAVRIWNLTSAFLQAMPTRITP